MTNDATFDRSPGAPPRACGAWGLVTGSFVALLLAACAASTGGEGREAAAGAAPSKPPIVPPRKLKFVAPQCTREAVEQDVQARVEVMCIILKEGVARDCRVIKGHPLLNDQALQAIAQQRFAPATLDGKPVDSETPFTFNFHCPAHFQGGTLVPAQVPP